MNVCRGLVISIALGLSLLSCAQPEQQDKSASSIPSYIRDPYKRLDYLVDHYWDNVDLRDSLWLSDTVALRQKFSDYFALLSSYPGVRRRLLLKPLDHIEGHLLERVLGYYKDYYLSPEETPVKDMNYVYLLLWATKSPKVRAEVQSQLSEELKPLLRNQVGVPARDFVYRVDSLQKSLRGSLKADYQILVLDRNYNPEADTLIREIQSDKLIAQLRDEHRLRVTIVYVGEQIPSVELLQKDSITPRWIEQGIDQSDSILRYKLYDVPQGQVIYLLDKSGKVLLKNATAKQLIKYFEDNA